MRAFIATIALLLAACQSQACDPSQVRARVSFGASFSTTVLATPFVPVQTFHAPVAFDHCASAAFAPSFAVHSFAAVHQPVFMRQAFAVNSFAINRVAVQRVAVQRQVFSQRTVIRSRTFIR